MAGAVSPVLRTGGQVSLSPPPMWLPAHRQLPMVGLGGSPGPHPENDRQLHCGQGPRCKREPQPSVPRCLSKTTAVRGQHRQPGRDGHCWDGWWRLVLFSQEGEAVGTAAGCRGKGMLSDKKGCLGRKGEPQWEVQWSAPATCDEALRGCSCAQGSAGLADLQRWQTREGMWGHETLGPGAQGPCRLG